MKSVCKRLVVQAKPYVNRRKPYLVTRTPMKPVCKRLAVQAQHVTCAKPHEHNLARKSWWTQAYVNIYK